MDGQPGVSLAQLALVTVMQYIKNLTDRQSVDAVRGRIDWKYALGLELSHCDLPQRYVPQVKLVRPQF
jgi:transposase